jgi:hypothetical protein
MIAGLTDSNYTDGSGRVWLTDRYFDGGSIATLPNHPIWGTREPRLYRSRRQGAFQYDIPLKPGTYEMRLYFAETHFGEFNEAGYGDENTRNFGISINGVSVMRRFSTAGEGGIDVAVVKVFRDVSPAADGMVHLTFQNINNQPFINAIEITPGIPGKLSPIRLIAQARAYTDPQGRLWEPDRLAVGGTLATRSAEIAGATDPQLFVGERFGNLTYTIPVTPGKYAVSLYMAERWFGPGQPGGEPGAGRRVYDILCNGVALERDFDLYARAGGAHRAFVRSYDGIEPNYQGNIVLSLTPIRNFPAVDALEILDESK